MLIFKARSCLQRVLPGTDLFLSVVSDNDSAGNGGRRKKYINGQKLSLDNFTVTTNTAGDSSDIHVRWNNWQDKQNKGDLRALARFSRPPDGNSILILPLIFSRLHDYRE